ncbi:MAG: MBL fold metallo-hydrolase [Candidatus Bathyarchaeota archaeon]|nr:MBL fold metallo-hydrolase [Candidatus Bathyarchaeota archaeon]
MKQTKQTIRKTLIITLILVLLASSLTPVSYAKEKGNNNSKKGSIVAKKISKSVVQFEEHIPLPNPLPNYPDVFYSVNVYAVNTKKGIVLIDSGHEDLVESLYDEIQTEFNGKPIIAVLLTHAHTDHAGGGNFFQEMEIPVFISQADMYFVSIGMNLPGVNPLFTYTGYDVLNTYENGPVKIPPGFKAVNTPGHTQSSVIIKYSRNNVWFTGDLTLPYADEDVHPLDVTYEVTLGAISALAGTPSMLEDQKTSLEGLLKTVSRKITIYPGHHGPYVGKNEAKDIINYTIDTINSLLS